MCDDTEPIRRLIRMNLELDGYDVVEASDGQAALELLRDPSAAARRHHPRRADDAPRRLVGGLADPRRPRLEHLPVVMVTASVQRHHRAQAEQAGVDAFVAKPFDPDD